MQLNKVLSNKTRPFLFFALGLFSVAFCVLISASVFAEEVPSDLSAGSPTEASVDADLDTNSAEPNSVLPDKSASQKQLETIVSSCGTLRASLKNVQRADSRARTYYGSIYENISSRFLIPLNLRLVKNSLSNPGLMSAQASLANLRADFSADFISYSKALELLVNIDCRLEPERFYSQLLTTRDKRAQVAEDMNQIHQILLTLPETIKILSENLAYAES